MTMAICGLVGAAVGGFIWAAAEAWERHRDKKLFVGRVHRPSEAPEVAELLWKDGAV